MARQHEKKNHGTLLKLNCVENKKEQSRDSSSVWLPLLTRVLSKYQKWMKEIFDVARVRT